MSNFEQTWAEYIATELPIVSNYLSQLGITLLETQPHTKGERFLMQALTTIGGKKLILLGRDKLGQKVVIKATNDPIGKQEIEHERRCRTLLHSINFSYESFLSPKEIYFGKKKDYLIFVTEFIEQSSSFLERPLKDQFRFSLRALKAQEQTRATTARHLNQINRVFGSRNSNDYLRMFDAFVSTAVINGDNTKTVAQLEEAGAKISNSLERIEQYGNFLTHTDFVPHNFRIKNDQLYLLDFSSLRFGNKHEGWARFLNFMTLYNRDLENILLEYVEKNRSKEERESLHLMRLFRLGEIIAYYTNTLPKSSGNLLLLNQTRIQFWTEVLASELMNKRVEEEIVTKYKNTRDHLRSAEEKERQIGLH